MYCTLTVLLYLATAKSLWFRRGASIAKWSNVLHTDCLLCLATAKSLWFRRATSIAEWSNVLHTDCLLSRQCQKSVVQKGNLYS